MKKFALDKFWDLSGHSNWKSMLSAGHRKASMDSGKKPFSPYSSRGWLCLRNSSWACWSFKGGDISQLHQENMDLCTPKSTQAPCQGVMSLSGLHGNLLTWPRKTSGAFLCLGDTWLRRSPACGRDEAGPLETLTVSSHWLFRIWAVITRDKQ